MKRVNGSLHMRRLFHENDDDFAYGAFLSILADISIACGLGLQKSGHLRNNRIAEDERESVIYQWRWVVGLMMIISGEVGNLLAYGDRETPTTVITSIGCIGVVANLVVGALFFREQVRFRDYVGSVFVVTGVAFIIAFAPGNRVKLNGDRMDHLLHQPGAIAIYVVYALAVCGLYFTVQRIGHKSVVWYPLLSALIGAFTVMASRPVATFLLLSFDGMYTGHFSDQIFPDILTAADCAASNGYGDGTVWKQVTEADSLLVDGTTACYFLGLGQLDQPTFWLAIVILVATAIAQVPRVHHSPALGERLSRLTPLRDRECAGQVP